MERRFNEMSVIEEDEESSFEGGWVAREDMTLWREEWMQSFWKIRIDTRGSG